MSNETTKPTEVVDTELPNEAEAVEGVGAESVGEAEARESVDTEPEQIEAKPLSAQIDSDPTLITSPSSLEPNSTPEPVVASSPTPVVEQAPVIEKPVVEEPTVIPESKPTQEVVSEQPSLVTNHLPLEPNLEGDVAVDAELPNEVSRPYSLDPKLNKAIEAFVRGMNNSKENLILAQKAVKAKMMKKVYRIMDLFKKKQKIKNDDVEKFIHTSDKTATKYLNILVKEGRIKKEGTNNKTYYKKTD